MPNNLIHFADTVDILFASAGLIVALLLLIWWRQQSERWYTIFASTLLASTLLDVGSFFLFIVPPHQAGCPDICPGRIGYPLPFATITLSGQTQLYLVDFLLNLLLLWLLWLGASVMWRVLSEATELGRRSLRFKILFVFFFFLLPWALMPRYFAPPQPEVSGNEQRLAINSLRAAENVYNVTGLWIHRLGLEDLRFTPLEVPSIFGGIDQPQAQVCLRGYTYFYIPWQRYRITLDRTGVTALNLKEMPLSGSCWAE